jgi:hypothetical protein
MTFSQPNEHDAFSTHSLDGLGAGDHDLPYRFGCGPLRGFRSHSTCGNTLGCSSLRSRFPATAVTAAEAA